MSRLQHAASRLLHPLCSAPVLRNDLFSTAAMPGLVVHAQGHLVLHAEQLLGTLICAIRELKQASGHEARQGVPGALAKCMQQTGLPETARKLLLGAGSPHSSPPLPTRSPGSSGLSLRSLGMTQAQRHAGLCLARKARPAADPG